MQVGSMDEARLVSTFLPVPDVHLEELEDIYPYDLPKGWRHIGSGTYRTAFLSPAGWVYKITNGRWRNDNSKEYNEIEYANYLRFKDAHVEGWYLPKTALYRANDTTVIAMEYVEGEFDLKDESEPFWQNAWNAVTERWNVIDIHPENVLVMVTGVRALIDFAP